MTAAPPPPYRPGNEVTPEELARYNAERGIAKWSSRRPAMARDIDRLIEYVRTLDYLPPVLQQVVVNRLDPEPTQDEIDRAREQVYP